MNSHSRASLVAIVGLTALALVAIGAGGGAVAAVKIGSKQIADNSIRSRDVRDGTLALADIDPSARAALTGAAGPTGAPGPAGVQGQPGAVGTAQVAAFAGPVGTIVPFSGVYVFAGPPAEVVTSAASPKVIATAAASLGLNTGSPQFADLGICSQPSAGGVLTNLQGAMNFATHYFTTTRATYAVAAAEVLPAGSYKVGFCVRNNGASTINNNNVVNGWVMVTS